MLRFLLIASFLGACTSTAPKIDYGLQPDHASYVPARIAVAPCQLWPKDAKFEDLPSSNANDADNKQLCEQFDKYVIQGFENQPFMRGYSPKNLMALLQKANQANALAEIPKLWASTGKEKCEDCENAAAFYRQVIEPRPEWRTWLNNLSKSARNADAILLPFVLYHYTDQRNDRGLFLARRAAGATILLIDTNYGYLLWAGGRRAEVVQQRLINNKNDRDIEAPGLDKLLERLLVEDLMKDFPGRQVYR